MYCFASFCNVCVYEDQNLIHLDTRAEDDTNLSCFEMLKVVSPQLVSVDKNLPRLICTDCYTELTQSYKFMQKCTKSVKTLEKFCILLKLRTDYVDKEIFQENRKRKMSLGYNKNTSKSAFYEMKRQKYGDTLLNVSNKDLVSNSSSSSTFLESGEGTINLRNSEQIEKDVYEQFEKFCCTLDQDKDSLTLLSESSKSSVSKTSPELDETNELNIKDENESNPNEDISLEILNLHSEEQFQKMIAANSFEFSLNELPQIPKKIELSAEEKFQKFIQENEFEVSLSQVSDYLKENVELINIKQMKMVVIDENDLTSDDKTTPTSSTSSNKVDIGWTPHIMGISPLNTSSSQPSTSKNLPTRYKQSLQNGSQPTTSAIPQLNTSQNVVKSPEIIEISPLTTSSSKSSNYELPLISGSPPIIEKTPQRKEKSCQNVVTTPEIIEVYSLSSSSSEPSPYKPPLPCGSQQITLDTAQEKEKSCQNVVTTPEIIEVYSLSSSSSQSSPYKPPLLGSQQITLDTAQEKEKSCQNVVTTPEIIEVSSLSSSSSQPSPYKSPLTSGSQPITLDTPQGSEKSCQNVARTSETIKISSLSTRSSQPSALENVSTRSKLSLTSGSQPITLKTSQGIEKSQNVDKTSEMIKISSVTTSSSQQSALENNSTRSKLSLSSGSQQITVDVPKAKEQIIQKLAKALKCFLLSQENTSSSQPSALENIATKSKLSLTSGSQSITSQTLQGREQSYQIIETSPLIISSPQPSTSKNVPTKNKLSLSSGPQPSILQTSQGREKNCQNVVRTFEIIENSPLNISGSQPSISKNVPTKYKLSLISGPQLSTLQTSQGREKNCQNVVRTFEIIESSSLNISGSQSSTSKNAPTKNKLSLTSGSQPSILQTSQGREKNCQNVARTSEIIKSSPLNVSGSQPSTSKNVPTKNKLSLTSGSQPITVVKPQGREKICQNVARTSESIEIPPLNTSSSQQPTPRIHPTSGAQPSKVNTSQNGTKLRIQQSNSKNYIPSVSSGCQPPKIASTTSSIQQINPERYKNPSTSGSQPYVPPPAPMMFKPSVARGPQPKWYNVRSVGELNHSCKDCKKVFNSQFRLDFHMECEH